jgi:hypothetical protein
MTIKIELDGTGRPVGAEGAHAVTACMATRHEPGKLFVRVQIDPVGDDALYAGSMEGVFTLTAPDLVPGGDPVKQAKAATDYAHHMIAAMQGVVAEALVEAFSDAAKDAGEAHDAGDEPTPVALALAAQLIAMSLLAFNEGDVQKAKGDAVRLAHGGEVHGLSAEATLSATGRANAIELLHAAIDALA